MKHHDFDPEKHAPKSNAHGHGRPPPETDLLSQVLSMVRLRGERIYAGDMGDPWNLSFGPNAAHFVFVSSGRLWATTAGLAPVELHPGDLVLLPQGTGHLLWGGSDQPGQSPETVNVDALVHGHVFRQSGGAHGTCAFMGGSFRFDPGAGAAVLAALPPILRIPRREAGTADWLEALTHFLLAEAREPAPGAALMISRLIDVLVIRAIRSWSEDDVTRTGWLGGIGDARIGRALSLMHDDPMRDWSVEELAREAGMSRSGFAVRFGERVGETPRRYLTGLRLARASDMLGRADARVGEVARRVGYVSESAFSRAFKAQFGHAPKEARRIGSGTYTAIDG